MTLGDGGYGACELCGNAAEFGTDWAVCARKCQRCGTFKYSSTLGTPRPRTVDHTVRLSGWVREQNDSGIEYPNITPDLFWRIEDMQVPGLVERANRALVAIAREWPNLDALHTIHMTFSKSLEVQGRSYSPNEGAAFVLIRLLQEQGYLRDSETACALSIQGLLAIEALGASKSASRQGFVAMSFAEDLREAWLNGFDPAIRRAGFVPLRIDAKDYVGSISDEIIAEIRRSCFVVADYTGQANGVYFEAGFALGMGLTVIPTCRADEVGGLHFDIRHLNTLLWNDPADLANGLSQRIMAVIGAGPQLG
jgi:hypothetical protein